MQTSHGPSVEVVGDLSGVAAVSGLNFPTCAGVCPSPQPATISIICYTAGAASMRPTCSFSSEESVFARNSCRSEVTYHSEQSENRGGAL